MKIKDIFETGLIRNDTRICIREFRWRNGECVGFSILASGYMNQERIQKHKERDADSFVWQDDDQFYIDVKEEN